MEDASKGGRVCLMVIVVMCVWLQGKITMDVALDIIDCYRRGGKVGLPT